MLSNNIKLDRFLTTEKVSEDANWSCYGSTREGDRDRWVKCKNKAKYHARSELVYTQLCEECIKDFRKISEVWEEGIDPIREKKMISEYFTD